MGQRFKLYARRDIIGFTEATNIVTKSDGTYGLLLKELK
jgi:hypothetical protein